MGELSIGWRKVKGLEEEEKINALFSLYTAPHHLHLVTYPPISLLILYGILYSQCSVWFTILLTVIRNPMSQINTITPLRQDDMKDDRDCTASQRSFVQ